MGKDKPLGPGLGVILLASIVLACVYWTTKFIENQDAYFYGFVGKMDRAIDEAYSNSIQTFRNK